MINGKRKRITFSLFQAKFFYTEPRMCQVRNSLDQVSVVRIYECDGLDEKNTSSIF